MTRRALVAAAVVASLIVLGAAAVSFVPASYGYSLATELAAAPQDDGDLERWLKIQPGVVAHTVHVERAAANSQKLCVSFIQVRTPSGRPPLPDLESAAKSRGYRSRCCSK